MWCNAHVAFVLWGSLSEERRDIDAALRLPARMVLGHSLRRAAGPMKTTVVRAATALAPALALWLASAEAPTRVYAQG